MLKNSNIFLTWEHMNVLWINEVRINTITGNNNIITELPRQ